MQKLTSYFFSLPWYAKLGKGITDLSVVTKHDDFAIFGGQVQKIGNFYPQKFQCKNGPHILPLCNGMWNLSVILLVWPSRLISQKWRNFVISAEKHPHFEFEKLLILFLKVSMQKLTSYPSSSYWYVKLGRGLLVYLWCVISQKWQKRTGFCKKWLYKPSLLIFIIHLLNIANIINIS